MNLDPDRLLFHYTTREAAFEHILPRGRLRFSRFIDMRDPLESKTWKFVGGGWGTADAELARRQAAGLARFHLIAAEIREQSYLLSMTMDAPKSAPGDLFWPGWARARMWEQYAENHAGVCLAFDRERLIESITGSLLEQEIAHPYHREVIYSSSGAERPDLDLAELSDEIDFATISAYIEAHHEELFFYKTLDWQSEWEYRFSTTAEPDGELSVALGDALAAVLVGERFPVWQRPAAIEAAALADAEILRVDWSEGAPLIGELRALRNRRDELREMVGDARGAGPPQAREPGGEETGGGPGLGEEDGDL